MKQGRDGVFCCNDRLAQAVLHWCNEHHKVAPPLVGFDDAPVAETLDLTTIALPWEEMIAGAADVIKRRLAGAGGAARQLIFTPRPVIRRL
jgi:DNA-binding LacI/PurR family transcriptional regulator